jgi:hypothetical protein
MTKVTRDYKIKNVELLIAAGIVVENALHHIDVLSANRSNWNADFFNNIKTKIDHLVDNVLGYDNLHQLKTRSQVVQTQMKRSLELLVQLKTQIEADFRKENTRMKAILQNLGFDLYYQAAKSKDQEATIQLLYRINTNLTPQLRAELEAKGITTTLLNNIVDMASVLRESNTLQELQKGHKKEITAQNQELLNDLYIDISNICKIARTFFKGNQPVLDKFSISKIVKTLNTYKPNPKDTNI